MKLANPFQHAPTHQRGAALVMALVFLIALTLLGLASMGGNVLQQRMTYSIGESNLGLQGAESSIAAGELWIESLTTPPDTDCASAALNADCSESTSIWLAADNEVTVQNVRDAAGTWWPTRGRPVDWDCPEGLANCSAPANPGTEGFRVAGKLPSIDAINYPKYVVEFAGKEGSLVLGSKTPDVNYYRITARGGGSLANGTPVITQSIYTKIY